MHTYVTIQHTQKHADAVQWNQYATSLYLTNRLTYNNVFCFLAVTCMTSTTISTCWRTSCSTLARPSIQSSTTWCQPPTARSSSPRYATSACPAIIHPGGIPTPWPATPSASPATTRSPPTSSKRQRTDGLLWITLSHTIKLPPCEYQPNFVKGTLIAVTSSSFPNAHFMMWYCVICLDSLHMCLWNKKTKDEKRRNDGHKQIKMLTEI